MNISDILMGAYAMESALLRTVKLGSNGSNAQDMCSLVLRDGMRRIETAACTVIGACVESAELTDYVSALQSLAFYRPIDSIATRRRIARRLLEEERYVV